MVRLAAYQCLRAASGKPMLEVDRVCAQRGLDVRDTALVRRIVGTEIRRRGTLRAVVAGFAHYKPKPDLATFLRLGIAQIMFLDRVPEHAAVSETVRACADTLGLSKGRIVNGVLRSVIRSLEPGHAGDSMVDVVGCDLHFDGPVFRSRDEHPHLWAEDALSLPATLHKRWTARFDADQANELAKIAMQEPPLSCRVRGDSSRDEVKAELDCELFSGAHPNVLLARADDASQVVGSRAFAEGRLTVQGEHALRAAQLLGDVRDLDVLDVCAAPGGKSAAIAEYWPRSITAVDVSAARLARARGTFERLGSPPPRLAAMDGTSALEGRFDAVFIDAPCSNTGVLAQRPAAKWRYGPKAQAELTSLQARLLHDAAERTAPGGRLVYSTCSLENEENERIVRGFLEVKRGWTLEDELRSLPHALDESANENGPIDGGYAARLRAPA